MVHVKLKGVRMNSVEENSSVYLSPDHNQIKLHGGLGKNGPLTTPPPLPPFPCIMCPVIFGKRETEQKMYSVKCTMVKQI